LTFVGQETWASATQCTACVMVVLGVDHRPEAGLRLMRPVVHPV